MLRLFKSSDPVTLVFLIIYAVIVNVKLIIEPLPIDHTQYYFISDIIFNKWLNIGSIPNVVLIIANIIFVVIQAILISMMMQGYKIISKPSLLPAMVFILLCSLFPVMLTNTPLIITGFFIIWILFKIFSAYNKPKADNIYFDTGLLNGVASVLYFPAILFSIYSLLSLVRIRTTTFREFVLFITGIFIIYFLVGTAIFWFDLFPQFMDTQFFGSITFIAITSIFTKINSIKFIIIGIVLVMSLLFYSNKFSTNLIQVRRYLGSFVMLFIFSILTLLLNKFPGDSGLYFILITTAIFIGYYFFHSPKRLGPEVMHLGLLGATFIFQYINFTI